MLHYLEKIDENHPDLVQSIYGFRPIKEMLPIWRGETTDWT
jgi:hypothetical protein